MQKNIHFICKLTFFAFFIIFIENSNTQAQNVGIGTVNPGERFEVAVGNVYLSSTASEEGMLILRGANNNLFELRPGQNILDGIVIRATVNPDGAGSIFGIESSGSSTRFGVTQSQGIYARDGLWLGSYDDGILSRDAGMDVTSLTDGNLQLYTNGQPRITVLHSNGNVGIGDNNPFSKLQVVGDVRATDGFRVSQADGTGTPQLHIKRDNDVNEFQLWPSGSGWADWDLRLGRTNESGGSNVGMNVIVERRLGVALQNPPTFRLQLPNNTSGEGRARDWTEYSDKRVKSDFIDLRYGIHEVMSLKPQHFLHYDSEFVDGELMLSGSLPTIGFSAQELNKIIPEAVMVPENETQELWGVDYDKLIPVLVKAIQEQQQIIERHEATHIDLESKINELKSKITNINHKEAVK